MQYNHNKDQVQVIVTLGDGRSDTHVGANKAHIDPNTSCLYVKINDGIVAAYAPGVWESAVTHAGETA